jgi:hypothetical protein
VHEALGRGRTLVLRLLPDKSEATSSSEQDTRVVIEESSTIDEFELTSLSSAASAREPYHKPLSQQFESIDAFYFPKMVSDNTEVTAEALVNWNAAHCLLLFQMTMSETHPVNAFGGCSKR